MSKQSKVSCIRRACMDMIQFNIMDLEEEQYRNWSARSPEIVEIKEDNKSIVLGSSKDVAGTMFSDVYVAVGKNDLHVVKWALDHIVSQENRVLLVHVFPPLSYICTPVGRLSRNQLSKDQVQVYIREESNKRKNLLQRYINLCNESKIAVDTMLVESNSSAKAILELILVANINILVMGNTRSQLTRLSRRGLGKGEYVKKSAPKFCEVRLVYDGKRTKGKQVQKKEEMVPSSKSNSVVQVTRQSERSFFQCVCFPGKFI